MKKRLLILPIFLLAIISIPVKVTEASSIYDEIKGISLNKEYGPMEIGDTEQLYIVYDIDNTIGELNDIEITWTSEDEKIATVDENGLVTLISMGSTTITAQVSNFTATFVVNGHSSSFVDFTSTFDRIEVKRDNYYTGSEINPLIKVAKRVYTGPNEYNEFILSPDDYYVTYDDNISITNKNSLHHITICGRNNYGGCLITHFYILAPQVTDFELSRSSDVIKYSDYLEPLKIINILPDKGELSEDIDNAIIETSDDDIHVHDDFQRLSYRIYAGLGEHNVTFTINGISRTYTLTVLPGIIDYITISNATVVYDGKSHGVYFKNSQDNCLNCEEIKYMDSEGQYTLDEMPTYINSGTYEIKYQITRPYYETITSSATLIIKSKDLNDTSYNYYISDEEYAYGIVEYDGSEKQPPIEIYDRNYKLTSNDYEVSYENNINPGKATITITGKGNYSGTLKCEFNIISPLKSISFDESQGTLNAGESKNLIVNYSPTNTTDDKTIAWSTSDTSVATVSNGIVKAIAPGQATITAEAWDKKATYIVTVKQPLTSISLNKTIGSLTVGSTETLTVTYNPTNTTDNKNVTWTSSDSSIAKVENGKITALKGGIVTITAKVGTKTATHKLTVKEKEILQDTAVKKGFKIKNSFIHGFKLADLLTSIKSKIGLNYSTTGSNTIIATGTQFKYNDEVFTAVVYGDLNGDGLINSADLLKMRQHLLGTSTLTGAYKEAASIATGTTINSADLLRIRQHLLGQKVIEQ